MPTKDVSKDNQPDLGEYAGTAVYRWADLANGDTGVPLAGGRLADRSVQVIGTFGVGGKAFIEGSCDGQNWAALNDPQGNKLEIANSTVIKAPLEAVPFLRPRVSGDGSTNLTILLFARTN